MEFFVDVSVPKLVERTLAHSSEYEWAGDDWTECNYNYRLNICDTVIYAVENNKTVGHLGLLDNVIKAVALDEEFQGQELSIHMYELAFEIFFNVYSDDAREPVADKIWEKLQSRYPDRIRYHKKKDQFEYNKDGFND
jgi:hypothetical protein